ncbi:hypothetical protein AGABI2DRAFT_179143 [Agaricus bisporus var. bisporus H97]|uniref:hypothetical protein n=1 Tax=Agaricus bisporus var. bisporus (strain H97 / ATCC MYA-4626 / FGSC 10389) TaxID=936046 RepID=UPI00029F792F|nr:hypothetical protein AGABI2DRAFT_179143 [Agaricus bisporus var. bisporus H97]EKV45564.1 hypothetical protein AGABI2DRAFT_179143 [Agaricus bisporus var. bisporus H97]
MREMANQGAMLSNFIYPSAPSRTQRYNLKRTIEDKYPTRPIQPLSINFHAQSTLPPGWVQHIHPEGLPYFVLSLPDSGPMQRIVTEEWMYDPDISELILDFIKEIQEAISEYKVTLWPESDLLVELHRREGRITEDDGHAHCGYYFVQHTRRCIYWLEEVKLNPTLSKALGLISGDLSGHQTQLCLEVEYWTYWNNFPTLQIATPDIYDYIVDTIMCMMTGRFMTSLTRDRLRNYYGTWGTRLNKHQSVISGKTESLSMVVDIVSPFLFFIPHALLERTEALMVDGCFTLHDWETFFDEIKEEWNQTALLATILLTANCAFLAIPIFQAPVLVSHSSPEQIASYVSLTTGLFGLVLALAMYRHHKFRKPSSPAEILAYIHGSYEERHDNVRWEELFLVWSLPHALIMWSATTFSVAFLLMCFHGTLTAVKVAVGLFAALLGSFTLYYVLKYGSGHYDAEMRRSLGHSQPEAQHKGSLDLSKSSDIGKSVISKNTLAVAGWGTWEPSIKCIKDVWMAAGAHGNH